MKKIFFCTLFACILCTGRLQAEELTVYMADANSLQNALAGKDLSQITSLKLTGNIVNREDIAWIGAHITNLQGLDMNGATISGFSIIPNGAFSGCWNLTSISLPQNLSIIGNKAFENCTGLKNINISNLDSIWHSAFLDCSGLISIDIPTNVKMIGDRTFEGCTSLAHINLPSALGWLGEYTFYQCSGLTSVTIPQSVSSIRSNTFSGCSSLSFIYVYNSQPLDLTGMANVFDGVDKTNCILYVPSGAKNAYQSANQWQNFVQIVEMNGIIPVTGVSLDKNQVSAKVDNVITLVASVTPANATNKSVVWTSDAPAIASVDATGKVTCMQPGIATITATMKDGGKAATCKVTVLAKTLVTGVTLSKSTLTIPIAGTHTLTATVLPADADNKKITWNSDHPTVASVDTLGKITAKTKGTASITVTTENEGKAAACEVIVVQPVTGISLDKTTLTLDAGKEYTFTATVLPADADNKALTWSSSKPGVASVDSAGKVKAVAQGSATITVSTKDGGKTASCAITVVQPVTGIAFDKTAVTVAAGSSEKLTAIVSPVDATNRKLTWETGDVTIATVDTMGMVTGVKAGATTITVTTEDGGKTASCAITVVQPVTGIAFDKTSITVIAGSSEKLTATVSPADATNRKLTWETGDVTIATVDTVGMVTGAKAGTTVVTATSKDGDKTASCVITVVQPVTGITFDKTSITVVAGSSEKLTATVSPADASNRKLTWETGDVTIATIDTVGTITGVKAGATTITATTMDGNKTASCTVIVTEVVLEAGTAAIEGTVDNVENGAIVFLYRGQSTLKSTGLDGFVLVAATTADADGSYQFRNLPAGTYKVVVEVPEYTSQPSPSIPLSGNDEVSGINFSISSTDHTITPNITTGINASEKLLTIVYPNPTSGLFTLNTDIAGTYRVTITNTSGKVLMKKTFTSPEQQMDISSYASGIYLIAIDNGQQRSVVKIVKK